MNHPNREKSLIEKLSSRFRETKTKHPDRNQVIFSSINSSKHKIDVDMQHFSSKEMIVSPM